MNNLCLYGASGHGKVVAEIAKRSNREISCFFDDNSQVASIMEVPVKSPESIENYIEENSFLIAIGNNEIRKRISSKISANYALLVDPTAILRDSVKVGLGSVVMSGVIMNAETVVGDHCIINSGAIIEHECIIGDFSHISPGATITGNVKIGEGTHVGANSVVIPNVTIGNWVTIGAGAVIIEDIPDYAVVVGNPGRIIKYNK